jgi:hypothetical protein
MKPAELIFRALTELPRIIDAVGALIESAGKATRRASGRPPAGTAEAEARYQHATRHFPNRTLRSERCLFCGVLLVPDNRDEHCPGPPR